MTTKQELVVSAAGEFGVNSSFDLTPEELQDGLKRLNRIAAQWDGQGIRIGFNLGGGLADEAGIPDTAENALVLALADNWAPSFGKQLAPTKRSEAAQAWGALYAARRVRPQVPQNPRMPLGVGNRVGVLSPQYFQPSSDTEGLNDGATEF